MESYALLADAAKEHHIFYHIQTYEKRYSHGIIGIMCRDVERLLLWQHRIDPSTGEPCRSFREWVMVAAPKSYAECYAAMKDVKELSDVPDEHLAEMRHGSFPILKQLSTAVRRDDKVLEAAKTQRRAGLVALVQKEHPEQALESTAAMLLRFEATARYVVDEAIEEAMQRGCPTREAAIEQFAANQMQDWRMEDAIEEAHSQSTETAQ